jgi:hypothetical protein
VRIEVAAVRTEAVVRSLVQEQFVHIETDLQQELGRIAEHLMAVRIEIVDSVAVQTRMAAVDQSLQAPPAPLAEFRVEFRTDFRNYFAGMKLPWNWVGRIS